MYDKVEKLLRNKQILVAVCSIIIVMGIYPERLRGALGGVQNHKISQLVTYLLLAFCSYFSAPLTFSLSLLYSRLLADESGYQELEMGDRVPNTYVSPYENNHMVRGRLDDVVGHDPNDRLAEV